MFFTRIPVANINYSDSAQQKSTRYFTFLGILIGFSLYGLAVILNPYLAKDIVIPIILAFAILITGCFHEDGLADSFDALWGGHTPQKRLEIMKDSRIGSYGTLATVLITIIKWSSLNNIEDFALVILIAHGLSRYFACIYSYLFKYYESAKSKSHKVLSKRNYKGLIINTIFIIPFCYYYIPPQRYFILLPLLAITWLIWAFVIKSKIGKITGDLLGAAQQISETIIYISFAVIL
jgi:adenosylcobinamide-GDP ribazoletransferase